MVDAEDQVRTLAQIDGQGYVNGTGVEGTQFGEDPHRAALGQQGDFVPLLQAEGHQAGSDAVGPLAGLLLGNLGPFPSHFFAQVGMMGELTGIFFDKVDDGRSGICHSERN